MDDMCLHRYERHLRIWEANFGREAGWIVERDGQPVAVLTDPRSEAMFWDSYRLEVVAQDPQLRDLMRTETFWTGDGWVGLVWRNREFGDIAEFAFPAAAPFSEPGRLTMRGLYLPIDWPRPWDRLVLWMRRFRSQG